MVSRSPLVSIKVASYNHAAFIGETIRSVLDQSFEDFELIIIDDASSDDSIGVIRSFSDPRIRVLLNDQNIGAAASSKRVKPMCRGQYFCSLDSDDYFHRDKLARQIAFMAANPAIDVVATFVHGIDQGGGLLAGSEIERWFSQPLDFNQPEAWLRANHICHSSALMKREVHDRLWNYDSGLVFTNDWYNWIRFLTHGSRFHLLRERLTYYRYHTGNITYKNPYRAYWEQAYISARELHPFLGRRGRRDLIRESLAGLFADDRYPASTAQRERLLRLLLDVGPGEVDFPTVWREVSQPELPSGDAFSTATVMIEELRQEVVDRGRNLESMRRELRRAERDRFWSLRPSAKRILTTLRAFTRGGGPRPYAVKPQPYAGMRRPKLVHALAGTGTNDSSQMVVQLIEGLGHEYDQVVLSSTLPESRGYVGCTVHGLGRLFELRAYFDRSAPEIVHVHYAGNRDWAWYDKVFEAATQAGCRLIENVNGSTSPYVLPSVSRYVYPSDYLLQTFGRGGLRNCVIYPGRDATGFSRRSDEVVSDNCIGVVSGAHSEYTHPSTIDLVMLVARRRPGTRVLILGDGPHLADYRQKVAARGLADSVSFAGAVADSELPRLYAEMSVFVEPMWEEKLNCSVPLAMSMGLPVVGYSLGVIEEMLGSQEFLAARFDLEELARITIRLLDDRKTRLAIGERNRARAREHYSADAMVRTYGRLYAEVIAGPPGSTGESV